MENYKNPNIRFKGFTDPWEQRKAKNLFVSTADKGHPELPVLSATQDRGMIRRDENSINIYHDKKNEEGYKRVLPGQFVIHLRSFQGGFAHSAIEGITSPAYTVFGFSEPEKHNPNYWKYVFTSKEFIRRLETVTYGIRDGRSISYDEFLTMDFVYPMQDEQTKIANYLDTLDNLITLHQRKYSKLLNVKESMLEKMFPKNGSNIPEIRFKGFTDPWEQRKLKETIEYIVDNRGKNPDYYCSEGIPVIDNFMIRNSLYPDLNTATRFIDENLYQNFIRKYNEEDDILLTLVGNGIGNITLFPKDKAVIIQNTLGFRAKVDKKFLFFLLMANNEALVKLDRGMAQPSIRQDEILDFDIYVPSNSEQTQIGEYFSSLDNLITLHQRELEKLQNIKKSMLEKMFV